MLDNVGVCVFPHLMRTAWLNGLKQQLRKETIRRCNLEIKKVFGFWQCTSSTFQTVCL